MADQRHDAIRKAIRSQTAANVASPQAARDALVRMGLYAKAGKVAAEYVKDRKPHATRRK